MGCAPSATARDIDPLRSCADAIMRSVTASGHRHPSTKNVSTNQLPVAYVVFSERSLQRVLLSKNLAVDDPSHERKKCEEPHQRQIHTRSLLSPYRERSTDSTALQG
jgi:hypothetical protein